MPVTRQHLISELLLKQFAVDEGNGLRLSAFNIEFRTASYRSPAAVWYVQHFIKHDSDSAEQVWGGIETSGVPLSPRSAAANHWIPGGLSR